MQEGLHISDSLSGVMANMPDEQKRRVYQMLAHYIELYKEVRIQNNAESTAHAYHEFIDEHLETAMKGNTRKVSCGSGCSFCCFQPVDITADEAVLLIEYCKEQGYLPNKLNLGIQAKASANGTFMQLNAVNRRCEFLDKDGKCKVYEYRPASCRKLVAVSKKKFCDTEKRMGAKVERMVSAEVEIIASAAFNASESGDMAKMILKMIK